MTDPLISLKEISISFQGRSTLNKIDLDVRKGEIVTLIGPNGAGKTTLVRIALGLQKPDSGKRSLMPGLRIGYMPQRLHINNSMPLLVKRFLALTNSKSHEITAALNKTGIKYAANSSVQALSGGEQQRVLLARALLNKPNLLVLDEPVQGVDINGQRELYQLITAIRNEQNCSVLMVSHDLHLVMASTDKVVCINQHVCCSGHPLIVRRHPAYLELFGRESADLAIYTHNHDHNHNIHGHVVHNHRKDS
ncbi:MAG: zinc ABC transporter ATP-binding protein ZnuC [Candidatus Endonucleobacter bathymodioli]|uniref:Zinc ABC transporter ATP-binding protein ZnuC n=1 Tax=Candidatus Endonucleibacter bathymodioli TaxID=539814 RepID=A0AA90NRV7_9GAMM|nr:zinc ABC transporter ATP-binding protein ZnuC [Candidatus Endonucleobacter bathymodioli]